MAVVGTSGTGKSSLIKAGVLPAILEGKASKAGDQWVVVSMNPGSSPIDNLANAISRNPGLTAIGNRNEFKKRDNAESKRYLFRSKICFCIQLI